MKTIKSNLIFFVVVYSFFVFCVFWANFIAMPGTGGREISGYNLLESYFITFFQMFAFLKAAAPAHDMKSTAVILWLALLLPFVFYVILPFLALLKVRFKENYFLWADIICFIFYTLVTLMGFSFFGFLSVVMFVAVIYFRVRQYKKQLLF